MCLPSAERAIHSAMSGQEPSGDDTKRQVEEFLASPELARAVDNDEFKQFLDHVPVAIVISRMRGDYARIVYCNQAYEALTGDRWDAVAGNDWSVLDSFFDEDDPERKLGAAIHAGDDFLGVFRRDLGGGQTILIEAYCGRIENADGTENYRIAAFVDVSDRDRTQREQLRQKVRDKDMLLKELQHRVKNNLQLVIALIRLEARQVREGGSFDLDRLARRVEALSLLYRALSPDAPESQVDLGHYLSEIASAVMRSHGVEGIRLEINVENCPISVNVAMPAGLVVNEVITNSFKHAFPDNRQGTIAIRCLSAEDGYYVSVEDDGMGLPVGESWPAPGKISDLMVRSLRENSGADMRVESRPNSGVQVSFKVKKPD
jgi:PAS domain S-box-containing protein